MCMLCVELEKGKMNVREVARAFREIELEDGHLGNVMVAIDLSYGLDNVAKALNELYEEERK